MNDTQTPIKYTANDIADRAWDNSDDDYLAFLKMKNYALSVEAELTAAREEVENLRHEYHGAKAMADGFKDKIKTVTEQRDRLADKFLNLFNAVKYGNFSNGEWDHGAYDEALQSLNQPER